MTTLSPWDRGSVAQLRPIPDRALILADFHVDIKTAVNETRRPARTRSSKKRSTPPVRATQTGFATLSSAIQDESISASERGELIAFPFLLIVLLLVFRSPIAAAIPLGFGAITVFTSRGILYFFTAWFGIDAFALTVCTMMGLALGVDYALLMVSRFREELAGGAEPAEAAAADPPHRRPHDGLRRQHPAALDAGLALHPAGLAARLAGRDGGDGRRPQRHRRDPGRPGAADPDRATTSTAGGSARRRTARARG